MARSILPSALPLGAPTSVSRAWAVGRRAERDVATIDEAIHGGGGIRHSELVDLTVGQAIPNKDFLRVRDTYGKPKLYISLSIFDWPPFLAK